MFWWYPGFKCDMAVHASRFSAKHLNIHENWMPSTPTSLLRVSCHSGKIPKNDAPSAGGGGFAGTQSQAMYKSCAYVVDEREGRGRWRWLTHACYIIYLRSTMFCLCQNTSCSWLGKRISSKLSNITSTGYLRLGKVNEINLCSASKVVMSSIDVLHLNMQKNQIRKLWLYAGSRPQAMGLLNAPYK